MVSATITGVLAVGFTSLNGPSMVLAIESETRFAFSCILTLSSAAGLHANKNSVKVVAANIEIYKVMSLIFYKSKNNYVKKLFFSLNFPLIYNNKKART